MGRDPLRSRAEDTVPARGCPRPAFAPVGGRRLGGPARLDSLLGFPFCHVTHQYNLDDPTAAEPGIEATPPTTIEIKVRKITARDAQENIVSIVEYPVRVPVGDDGQPILADLPADVRPAPPPPSPPKVP